MRCGRGGRRQEIKGEKEESKEKGERAGGIGWANGE